MHAQSPDVPGTQVNEDTMPLRSFDTIALQSYASKKAFQYGVVQNSGENLFSRLRRWFWEQVGRLLGTSGTQTGYVILFLLILLTSGILVYYFSRVHTISIFRKADRKQRLPAELVTEELKKADLEAEILKARKSGDFSQAIRLRTIQILLGLERAGALELDASTTIAQYRKQLQRDDLREAFNELTRTFEFVWYGDYRLGPDQFYRLEERYKDFYSMIQV